MSVCSVCARDTYAGTSHKGMARRAVEAATTIHHTSADPNPCWFNGLGCTGMEAEEIHVKTVSARVGAEGARAKLPPEHEERRKAIKAAIRAESREKYRGLKRV